MSRGIRLSQNYTRSVVPGRSLSEEIQRLRTENARLQERVTAFERSRWWRLHPRLAWRRATKVSRPRAARSTPSVSPDRQRAPDPVVERFRTEVMARGSFTQDWFTTAVPGWHAMVAELEGRQVRILEIGSFEGLSACYLLWRLPDARLTCLDTFAGSHEHDYLELEAGRLEAAFDRNVALVDARRVRKIVGDSKRAMLDLLLEAAGFELIYVDGSHAGLDVIVDAALSWQLLEIGGIVVFDDYAWTALGTDPLSRPGPAIDAFLHLIEGKYEVVLDGHQLGLRKLSE